MAQNNTNIQTNLSLYKEQSTLFYAMICSCIDQFENNYKVDKLNNNLKKAVKTIKKIIFDFKKEENLDKHNYNNTGVCSTEKTPKQNVDLTQTDIDDVECAICLDEILQCHAQARLSCKHLFHLSCAGSTFNNSKFMRCPICRCCQDKSPGKWLKPFNLDVDGSASSINTLSSYENRSHFGRDDHTSTQEDSRSPRLSLRSLYEYHNTVNEASNWESSESDTIEDSQGSSEENLENNLDEVSERLNALGYDNHTRRSWSSHQDAVFFNENRGNTPSSYQEYNVNCSSDLDSNSPSYRNNLSVSESNSSIRSISEEASSTSDNIHEIQIGGFYHSGDRSNTSPILYNTSYSVYHIDSDDEGYENNVALEGTQNDSNSNEDPEGNYNFYLSTHSNSGTYHTEHRYYFSDDEDGL